MSSKDAGFFEKAQGFKGPFWLLVAGAIFLAVLLYFERFTQADFASWLGVHISLCGFWATIKQVLIARSASEEAAIVTAKAMRSLDAFQIVSESASAMQICDELTGIHLNGQWSVAPYKYQQLRRRIIAIRDNANGLSKAKQGMFKRQLTDISNMKVSVENHLTKSGSTPDSANFNEIISRVGDEIQSVEMDIRKKSLEAHNE